MCVVIYVCWRFFLVWKVSIVVVCLLMFRCLLIFCMDRCLILLNYSMFCQCFGSVRIVCDMSDVLKLVFVVVFVVVGFLIVLMYLMGIFWWEWFQLIVRFFIVVKRQGLNVVVGFFLVWMVWQIWVKDLVIRLFGFVDYQQECVIVDVVGVYFFQSFVYVC